MPLSLRLRSTKSWLTWGSAAMPIERSPDAGILIEKEETKKDRKKRERREKEERKTKVKRKE